MAPQSSQTPPAATAQESAERLALGVYPDDPDAYAALVDFLCPPQVVRL